MATVALIGDSHSQIHFNQLRPYLEEAGHEIVFRSSEPGWGVQKFLSTGKINDLAGADHAVVALGGNNFKLEEDRYFPQIKDFIKVLRDQGIEKIVWLGPFESDSVTKASVQDRHQWTADFLASKLPKDRNIFWIDMRPFSKGGPWRDGVHFKRDKYQEMTDAIAPQVVKSIGYPLILLRPHRTVTFWAGLIATGVLVSYLILRGMDDVYRTEDN